MKVLDITSEDALAKALDKGLCLINFHVPWCAPCRAQEPILENLARSFEGKSLIGTMNTENHGDVARRLNIEHLPTLIFFQKGRELERMWGLQSEPVLGQVLTRLISGA